MNLIRFDFSALLRISQYFINTFPGRPDIFNVRDQKFHRLRWHRKVSNATAWWLQQTHARSFQEAQHL